MRVADCIYQGLVTGSCEHDNEHSCSVKEKEFLDWMTN
jgi:hypothetical protein